jgi:hypothetical protein
MFAALMKIPLNNEHSMFAALMKIPLNNEHSMFAAFMKIPLDNEHPLSVKIFNNCSVLYLHLGSMEFCSPRYFD